MTVTDNKTRLLTLINLEGRLLDEWRLREWLALFDERRCRYWIPIDENKDPASNSSILYEDYEALAMRVYQLSDAHRVSQIPRSQLLHQLGSVEVEIDGETASARYALCVFEVRSGDHRQTGLGNYRFRAGTCEMVFAQTSLGWRVCEKKILLLDRRLPQESLSYLL